MNRRNFIGNLIIAGASFAILPGAGRIWKSQAVVPLNHWILDDRGFYHGNDILMQGQIWDGQLVELVLPGHWSTRVLPLKMPAIHQKNEAGGLNPCSALFCSTEGVVDNPTSPIHFE